MQRSGRRLGAVIAGVVVAGVAAGIAGAAPAGSGRQLVAASAGQAEVGRLSSEGLTQEEVSADTGIVPGQPIRVSPADDLERYGYIEWDDAFPKSDASPALIDVHDEKGRKIAYFGPGLGWVDLEVGDDPAFDYREALEAKQRAIADMVSGTDQQG